ncbi:MAG TPA: pyrimidine-nucleoside phosphorylase [Firmicutes bacterium]|jgi:pyrimidine-nucleoside phosphorylase|nr:pyrimidine-nucleoside phosphorylase [Bacillota bacterium]HHT42727.1 pyrimidine-nucleoside phosphorylase [Bacillota bacterium]
MHAVELIQKKRDGKRLSLEELKFLVHGYVQGQIPDYQMAAWTMAVFFQGMEPEEITDLTLLMAGSGDTLDLSAIHGVKVDKHSTGGVGDTTTLVLAPLVASVGVPVAKMSGRGLGHTGGTIDKLESIPGFQTSLTPQEFISQVNRIGVGVVGQTGELAPADKLLYALRDVTATVESIPLIASSIMSKKIAAGADGFVLDVKVGRGAFMKQEAEAVRLAETMVQIGTLAERATVALVTDMNQPLGRCIGNALEVKEAILTLKGQGPANLTELCLQLGTEMLLMAGACSDAGEARRKLEDSLQQGRALAKFREWVEAQGGDPQITEDLSLLPQAKFRQSLAALKAGYVQEVDPLALGAAAMHLGAGRETKDSVIDLAVGIELKVGEGDYVGEGSVLAEIYANDQQRLTEALQTGLGAFRIGDEKPPARPLVYRKITAEDV